MSLFWTLVKRDLARSWRGPAGAVLPLLFFLIVATLFPFAVGPDGRLLSRIGGGVLWVAALLAALLPIERLVEPDRADGSLDQLLVRGIAPEMIALAKIVAHWLAFGPPLLLAVLPGAALLRVDGAALLPLLAGLAIGTPAFAALGVTVAALTSGIRGAGALAGLIVAPLAVPLLIFGAGALLPYGGGGLKLLAASSLVLVALAPFAAGAALKAGVE